MSSNPYAPPLAPLDRQPMLGLAAPALWNPDAAGAWSLLLTPIFGSALVWMNWNAIGERSRARTALLWLAASVLVVLTAVVLQRGFALLYIILWYFACQRPQTQYVHARWDDSYPRKPWLVPILGTVGGFIALLFVLGFLLGS